MKRIYFSGIGGVGLGPLARIAHDTGYEVLGSDREKSLMSAELETSGVKISYDQSGEYLRAAHEKSPIDWFVYTSALPENHSELLAARELDLKISKRDELLAHIIDKKNIKLLAIAGTHGKTTTTGMMVWTLKQLGIPVSYSIGTTLSWGPSGNYDPNSQFFVYECDEFDRNFLSFQPFISLITALEHDHVDTYKTEDDYKSAFRQFIHQSEHAIMWQTDADYAQTRESTAWALQPDEMLDLPLAGAHNRRNATLVLKAIEHLANSFSEDFAFPARASQENRQLATSASLENDVAMRAKEALETFPGTNRRFEKLAENLYSDYGHTPTEIAATLQMAREISDHVTLIYQPHQNTRQHEIRDQYTDEVFADADEVIWLPTYLSRENSELDILSPEILTENLNKTNVTMANLNDDLWSEIETSRATGNLVLCMGAGSIDSWVRQQR